MNNAGSFSKMSLSDVERYCSKIPPCPSLGTAKNEAGSNPEADSGLLHCVRNDGRGNNHCTSPL
jgi:hypothetical protein